MSTPLKTISPSLPRVSCNAILRYKVGRIRDGKREWLTDWKDNLILDSGLNKVAANVWVDCFAYCLFGNAVTPNPVSRNNNVITFSQTGTTITASGSFFVSGDTGRLFKYGTGTGGFETYITYVNATTATASISQTVASTTGTVWYVNQTALDLLLSGGNTYDTSTGGANGTTTSGNVITHQRTYIGAAAVSPTTVTEIGFSNSATNSNIFDRDIVIGGVSLNTGDQPVAIAQMIITYNPSTQIALGNVGTGFNTSGNIQVTATGPMTGTGNISYVQTTGAGDPGNTNAGLEPCRLLSTYAATATFTIPAFTNGSGPSLPASVVATTNTLQTYTNGNFYIDVVSVWNISTANGVIYGFFFANRTTTVAAELLLTSTFTKTSAQTLTLTSRRSWQRVLSNP